MILFPYVQDIAAVEIAMMPDEMLQFFGMNELSDMSNYNTYFGMIYTLMLVAISIFSVTFSAGLIYKEEKTKSIEYLNSMPVSRTEIFLSKLLTAFCAIFIIIMGALIITLTCGFINGGETFIIMDTIKSFFIMSIIPYIFSMMAISLAAIKFKLGSPFTVSSIVIFTYLLGYLSELLGDKGKILKYISPFSILTQESSLVLNSNTITTLISYILICILLLILGMNLYNKRDYSI